MKFELKEHYWRVPDQIFIDDVIAVAKKLGKNTITKQEYLEHGIHHSDTLRCRFGSWFNVMQKAGLKPTRWPINSSEELLFKNLEDVWTKLGRQPCIRDLKNPELQSQCSPDAYKNRFGTWMNGLRKFIEYQNSKSPGRGKILQKKILKKYRRKKNKKVNENPRHITIGLRYSVFIRDGFRCTACGRSPLTDKGVKLHCDHIRAWSKGGRTVLDNLQTLCSECNLGNGSKLEISTHPRSRPFSKHPGEGKSGKKQRGKM